MTCAVLALTLGFPNSAAVGLPLLASVFGPSATVTVAVSLAIGSITVSPITLMILEATVGRAKGGFGWNAVLLALWHSIKKPIVWAPILGLAFSCAGLNLPIFASRSLAVIGSAADGAALVLTGLVVSAQVFQIRASTLVAVFLKNAVQPALVLGGLLLFGYVGNIVPEAVLTIAIPTMPIVITLAVQYRVAEAHASSALFLSVVGSIVTMGVFIALTHQMI